MAVQIGDRKYLVGTSTLVEIVDIHEGTFAQRGRNSGRHGLVATGRVISTTGTRYVPGDIVRQRGIQAFVDKRGK